MRHRFKDIVLILILFFITSCTFDFSEDYFNDIQLNEPNVTLTLTGFENGETTSNSKIVQYDITGTGNDEFEMIVKVNGQEIYSSPESTGEFYLSVDDLDDGEHILTIDYIFPTNSGSLANSIGGEFFVGFSDYNFTVDKSLAAPFGIAEINIIEGSIFITLNPIVDYNFNEAFLVIQAESGFLLDEIQISEEDLTDLVIHDDQTFIYNPKYAIKLKNTFAENTSDFVTLTTPKMNLVIEPIPSLYERYKLIYNEHPLYGNFDDIRIEYYDYLSGNSNHTLNSQGGETIINENFYFGTDFTINYKFFKNNSFVGNYPELNNLGSTLPIPEFDEITYVPSINKYFAIDITTSNDLVIHQLNGQSFEIEDSQTLTTLDSLVDFKSLEVDPASSSIIINMNGSAILFNPLTFSIQNTYDAIDFNANMVSADVYYRDDYVILEEPWSSGDVLIYEIATGTLKFSISKTTNFFSAVDASFFYANGDLYKLETDNFVFVNTIQDSQNNTDAPDLEHMTFDKISNSAVFGWHRDTYYLDLSNYNQTYIWDTEIVYDVKYTDDGRPFIHCDHFSAGNKSHIYDVNLNETVFIDTFAEQSYRYLNGHIFSPNGYYLETNLYPN